ncbi:MAG: hypothetical protein Q4D26_10365 [Clostridia bacterium]|nr:hypothetical protein [Clostridia bacterium]
MSPIFLINDLKYFVQECTKDLLLEVKTNPKDEKVIKPANVFIGSPPAKVKNIQYIPYIILRLLTGKDEQKESEEENSTIKVRLIAATYSEDSEKGYIDVMNVIDRLRIELLKNRVLNNKYTLKLPLEYIIYEDDTGPYSIGEIITTWEIPSIRQEVNKIWH